MELPSPTHAVRAGKGEHRVPCWERPALLRAPGARISDWRGNELSSLIHSLLQDQTWPASRSSRARWSRRCQGRCWGCPLGVRVLPGAPGRGEVLLGRDVSREGCSSGSRAVPLPLAR